MALNRVNGKTLVKGGLINDDDIAPRVLKLPDEIVIQMEKHKDAHEELKRLMRPHVDTAQMGSLYNKYGFETIRLLDEVKNKDI